MSSPLTSLRDDVLAVYARVDAAIAVAKPRCEASGRCCRFTEYGHTLFLSQFEADILLETAPDYDGPITRDGCPFQINNLCTARHERPIGCRTYFCDPNFETGQQELTEWAVSELKRIAERHGAAWRYAPLHVFLNAALPRPRRIPLA
jgi:Fe-S-cluster containining protein